MVQPDSNDVVVQPETGNPTTYVLGTFSGPEQFRFRTRDEAVSRAMAFAKHQHVRAWFAGGDDTFVLLGAFRTNEKPLATTRCETCGGSLVTPQVFGLPVTESDTTAPDCICVECQRGYCWQGNPPRLGVRVPRGQ